MPIKRVLEFLVDFIPQRFALALVFISIVLLICDRESEEIFYKERPVEEEEEEEA